MQWFLKNIDAFIINTIFLVLSYFLSKPNNSKYSSQNINIYSNNISYNKIENNNSNFISNHNNQINDYITNNLNTYKKYRSTSTASNSDNTWITIFFYSIAVSLTLYFFYKYYNSISFYVRLLIYTGLLSSFLIFINFYKEKNLINYHPKITRACYFSPALWLIIFINSKIIDFQINNSDYMKVFHDNFSTTSINGILPKTISFANNYRLSFFMSIFLIGSFVITLFIIIYSLFLEFAMLSFARKYSLSPITLRYKLWDKINSILIHRFISLNFSGIIMSSVIMFLLSTGIITKLIEIIANLLAKV